MQTQANTNVKAAEQKPPTLEMANVINAETLQRPMSVVLIFQECAATHTPDRQGGQPMGTILNLPSEMAKQKGAKLYSKNCPVGKDLEVR